MTMEALLWVDSPISRQGWVTNGAYVCDKGMEISVAEEFDGLDTSTVSQVHLWILDNSGDHRGLIRRLAATMAGGLDTAYILGLSVPAAQGYGLSRSVDSAFWTTGNTATPDMGNVVKRIASSAMSSEEWWPGAPGTAAFFAASGKSPYESILQESLRKEEYNEVWRLLFMPRLRFALLVELIASSNLYVYASRNAAWFFFNTAKMDTMLSSIAEMLRNDGIEVFRSRGAETISYWVKHKSLPQDVERLSVS